MVTLDSITTGVFAGVLSSAVLYLFVWNVKNLVIPWYRKNVYRGQDISGAWNEKLDFDLLSSDLTFYFSQREQDITGQLTVVKSYKDLAKVETKMFLVEGTFCDGYLMITCRNADQRYRGHMVFLLKVARGGVGLEGAMSWLDSDDNKITAREVEFSRELEE